MPPVPPWRGTAGGARGPRELHRVHGPRTDRRHQHGQPDCRGRHDHPHPGQDVHADRGKQCPVPVRPERAAGRRGRGRAADRPRQRRRRRAEHGGGNPGLPPVRGGGRGVADSPEPDPARRPRVRLPGAGWGGAQLGCVDPRRRHRPEQHRPRHRRLLLLLGECRRRQGGGRGRVLRRHPDDGQLCDPEQCRGRRPGRGRRRQQQGPPPPSLDRLHQPPAAAAWCQRRWRRLRGRSLRGRRDGHDHQHLDHPELRPGWRRRSGGRGEEWQGSRRGRLHRPGCHRRTRRLHRRQREEEPELERRSRHFRPIRRDLTSGPGPRRPDKLGAQTVRPERYHFVSLADRKDKTMSAIANHWTRRPVRPAHRHETRLGVEALEDRTVPSVTLLDDFAGLNFHIDRPVPPPDTHLAVGPHHLVEVVNNDIAFFNKSNSNPVETAFLTDFFAPLGPFSETFSTVDAFDPQVSYDEIAERFIVTALSRVDSVETSHLLLAVSDDDDPRGGWEMHRIDVEDGDAYWGDFDRLGWDADGIYVSMGMLSWNNRHINHSSLITIDKASVLDNDNSTLTYFDVDRNAGHLWMQPAVMRGANPGDPMFFVQAKQQGGNSLLVTKMTDKLSANPTFTDFQVPVAHYDTTPDATQPSGDLLDTGMNAQMISTAWRDDRLVAALHAGDGDLMRASWYEFNTNGPEPTLVQSGRIDPGPGIHTYYPSIEIAPNGDLGMTFMQSSATEFPSVYITGRKFADAIGVMQTPVLVKAGEASLRSPDFFDAPPIRVGDYSGIAIDPSDGSFWAANEYAKVVPDLLPFVSWGTWIANFSISFGRTTGTAGARAAAIAST